jgi:probable blue pigment (indigoidine) exporter
MSPVVLVTAVAPAVWGSTYVVTTTLLPDGRPLLAGVLRALPAGLLLLAVTRRLPQGSWWWRSAVLGTLNIGAFFALLFVSAYRLAGGVAAVLGAVGPLLVLALGSVLLGERATRRAVVSAVVAAAGVGLTVLTAAARLDAWGVAAGLAGAGSMALGLVLTRRWGRPAPALTTTGWQLTAGGLVLLPLALLVEGPPPALSMSAVGGYAYLSLVGSAVAYVLWFRGLERLPAASVSMLGQLSPVVAATLGWAVLQQRLTPVQLVGMALAVGGVVAGQAAPPPQDVVATTAEAGRTGGAGGSVGGFLEDRGEGAAAPAVGTGSPDEVRLVLDGDDDRRLWSREGSEQPAVGLAQLGALRRLAVVGPADRVREVGVRVEAHTGDVPAAGRSAPAVRR